MGGKFWGAAEAEGGGSFPGYLRRKGAAEKPPAPPRGFHPSSSSSLELFSSQLRVPLLPFISSSFFAFSCLSLGRFPRAALLSPPLLSAVLPAAVPRRPELRGYGGGEPGPGHRHRAHVRASIHTDMHGVPGAPGWPPASLRFPSIQTIDMLM